MRKSKQRSLGDSIKIVVLIITCDVCTSATLEVRSLDSLPEGATRKGWRCPRKLKQGDRDICPKCALRLGLMDAEAQAIYDAHHRPGIQKELF